VTSNQHILLATACFAPVQYYTKMLMHKTVYIEQYENFIKQTWRNRYTILGGNGPIDLIVPVVKGRGLKILIKDLEISYDTDWQRNHWRTLFSAYNTSPYFEYYADDLQPFFEKKYKFLFDFNLKINETLLELLELDNTILLTADFQQVPDGTANYRELISPKEKTPEDPHFHPASYTQVFSDNLGFFPNLSMLDLLFNEGPNSYSLLKESIW
jgi:hypothetical protein